MWTWACCGRWDDCGCVKMGEHVLFMNVRGWCVFDKALKRDLVHVVYCGDIVSQELYAVHVR